MNTTRTSWIGAAMAACLLLVGLTACEAEEPAAGVDEATHTAMDGTAHLTQEERDAGWQMLFDGENLDGWRSYRGDSVPSKWQITDGTLHLDPEAEGQGGSIMTDQAFGDFEFSFDFKIAECGNSGVIYLIQEMEQYRTGYMTGPEYQVLDDACYDEMTPAQMTGSNYDLISPSADAVKPAGEWNEGRIVKTGDTVEHWLNGEKVVEYELGSDNWKQLVSDSKFQQWPDYGLADEGHIALQDHGNEVWYRNLKIRSTEAGMAEAE